MDYEVKVIPEQKLGVINCKTPIEDLGIFLSMLKVGLMRKKLKQTVNLLLFIFHQDMRLMKAMWFMM